MVDLAWSAWGDGRRRGGDRRGKVDAEGLLSCRRRGVVVVAVHATREVVEVVVVGATREEVVAAHRGGRRRGDVVEVVVVGATREEVVVEAMWWRW